MYETYGNNDRIFIENIKPYPQNGPSGCVTACLANVARVVLNEDITPIDVDRELNRGLDDEIMPETRNRWMLERGLRVRVLNSYNPTQFTEHLEGKISFEQLLRNFAEYYFDGDRNAARLVYDNEEYKNYIEERKRQKKLFDHFVVPYIEGGQYSESVSQPEFRDITTALEDARVVLLSTKPVDGISHQILAYESVPSNSGKLGFNAYFPNVTESYVNAGFVEGFNSAGIDLRSLVVVSK